MLFQQDTDLVVARVRIKHFRAEVTLLKTNWNTCMRCDV